VSAAREPSRCERARAWAALAPDGELAMLESRLLEAHLAHCAGCRSFAEQVTGIAAELRAAAVERSSRRVVLPAAPARRSAPARVRSVASVAAVAAMALGIAMRAPLGDPERPSGPPAAAPADVYDAELHTIRLLRREAMLAGLARSERASGTFGNQPA
jgi:hypothetical protein